MGAHQGVIYCNGSAGGANGWSFPRPIDRRLQRDHSGLSVLHLFGGASKFGIRLDMDPSTKPDVIGDAWLPPFSRDSFDVVILDPPYKQFGRATLIALGRAATWIARKRVVWFSSLSATSMPGCSIEKWWTVITGNECQIRQLAYFTPRPDKMGPVDNFRRGPAFKYNRWLRQPQQLPFN